MAYENMSRTNEEELLKIQKEFRVLDLNGDGKVSKDEMLNFLAKKNIDEDHRVQIVDELFSKCDHDGNGYVDIEEFGQEYISTKAQLQHRELELKQQIMQLHRIINDKSKQLEIEKRKAGGNIYGPCGKLTLTVKEAFNLPAIPVGQSYVVIVQHGNMVHTTQPKSGPRAVINEPCSINVDTEELSLIISVEQAKTRRQILMKEITFAEINNPEREVQELLRTLRAHNEDPSSPTVTIDFKYEPNHPVQLSQHLKMHEYEMKEAVTLLSQVRVFIEQLSTPFGFLQNEIKKIHVKVQAKEMTEKDEEEHGDLGPQFHEKEKNAEQHFDKYAEKINEAFNKHTGRASGSDIAWEYVLQVTLWVYLVLTILSSLMRPDFMSLTCVGLGFLAVSEPTRFGRRVFRIVVGLLATTFVYDLIWLFWLRSSEAENFEDGAGAWWIRKFSLINSYISFFFRIAVIGVFWKVSLNYRSILKKGQRCTERSSDSGMAENSFDEGDIDLIMAKYGGGLSP